MYIYSGKANQSHGQHEEHNEKAATAMIKCGKREGEHDELKITRITQTSEGWVKPHAPGS